MEKARRTERRRRAEEENKEARRIHWEEREEAPEGRTASSPLDRVVALIASNEGDEGGCPVYGADIGDTGKV